MFFSLINELIIKLPSFKEDVCSRILLETDKEMLADFVRQYAVIWEVKMARKNGHDGAVFRANKIQKLLRVGVGLVVAVLPP